MSRIRVWLCLLLVALGPSGALAAGPVILSDGRDEYNLGQALSYLEDPSGEMTVEDVASPEAARRFVRSETSLPSFGFTRSAYWVRIPVLNLAPNVTRWRLVLEYPNMHRADFYTPRADGSGFTVVRAGTQYPFSSRQVPYHRLAFLLSPPPGAEQTVYLRLQNDWAMVFPLSLYSPRGFLRYSQRDALLSGLQYGALLLLVVYNLFLWLSVGERDYGYYVGVLACFLLGQAIYEGYAGEYLWPRYPHLNEMLLLLFFPVVSILGMLFSVSFLDTRRRAPAGHRIILGFIALWCLLLLLVPLLGHAELVRVAMPLRAANSLVLTGVYFLIWRSGYRPARFFFLAWLMLALTFLPFALMRLDLMRSYSVLAESYRFGIILTGLFFSFALADRIEILRKEKSAAQQRYLAASRDMERMIREQNVHLEENVRERTRELTQEIQERQQTEAELKEAKDRAEAASRAKSRFLSMVSHELRTPLNAILGYAQLLGREAPTGGLEAKGLKTIEQSGRHLLQLIEDLLDRARLEVDKIELSPVAFNLPEQLDMLAGMIRLRARQKGLAFTWEPPPDLPVTVLGDAKRISQVLLNLLGNAIKFTERGCVGFAVERQGADSLEFSVTDTGPGIPEDKLEEIFIAYVQLGGPRKNAEGIGLGLTLCRTLLRLMGSDLGVESEPGKGSTFRFTLRLPEAEWEAAPAPGGERPIAGVRGRRPRVLVVDDHEDNRGMLRHTLSPLGFEISEAGSGQEALRQAGAEAPDLVIMDLMMPEMDGREATRRLRQTPGLAGLKILVITADAAVDPDGLRAETGCDGVLTKPLDTDVLLEQLRRHLDLEWIHEGEEPPGVPQSPVPAPPSAGVERLLGLARIGAFTELSAELVRLREHEPGAAPFADYLLALLEAFRFDDIAQALASPDASQK